MGSKYGFVDFRLHLNGVSWQILHALEGEPDFAPYDKERGEYKIDVNTFTFYDGRERGFTLQVCHSDRFLQHSLYISFAQQANSDDISIYHWTRSFQYNNPPTPYDLHEAGAWDSVYYAKTVDQAVEYIRKVMKEYLISESKLLEVKEVLDT